MDVVTWILAGLLAVVFVGAGALKLVTPISKLRQNPSLGWTVDATEVQVKAIAALEVLGAVGLVLPWMLDVAHVLTPLAAVGLAVIMVGAMITHGRRGERQQVALNVVLLILAVVVAVLRFGQL